MTTQDLINLLEKVDPFGDGLIKDSSGKTIQGVLYGAGIYFLTTEKPESEDEY